MAKKKQVIKNKSFDFILFIVVLLLLALGITMVLSASSPSALATTGSSYTYVTKQIMAAIIGVIVMLIISRIDYKKYAKYYKLIYIFSVVILLLVLIPGVGRTVNGATRWINVPLFGSLQPSEITKLGLIVFFAGYLSNMKKDLKDIWKGFLKPLMFFLLPPIAILLLVQSHFSASVIIILVVCVMMMIAGSRIFYFITFGSIGAGGLLGGMYILAKKFGIGSFRLTRITAFLNPWADAQDSGWQIIQGLYAIGSGGLFGAGLRK